MQFLHHTQTKYQASKTNAWCVAIFLIKGKLQSKIIISHLVGLFRSVQWWNSNFKLRTRTRSNRLPKMAIKSRVARRGRYYITGARHQEFEAVKWSSFLPGVIRLLRQAASSRFWLIMNISNHSRDLTWLRGGTTDVTKVRMCHIFWLSVWPSSCSTFEPKPSPLDSTEKIYQISAYDFGVQFSFKLDMQVHDVCNIYWAWDIIHR